MRIYAEFFLMVLLLSISCHCYSQHIEFIDTIKSEYKSENSTLKFEVLESTISYYTYSKLMGETFLEPTLNPVFFNITDVKNVSPFSPYTFSKKNSFEGITFKGIYGCFQLTDFFSVNINAFLSSSYYGSIQPYRYVNGSIKIDLMLKLHDRVQLYGEGQVSAREGLDPELPTSMGGANYYGFGVQFKVSKRVGIGFGVKNYYYRGNWTKRAYAAPVSY